GAASPRPQAGLLHDAWRPGIRHAGRRRYLARVSTAEPCAGRLRRGLRIERPMQEGSSPLSRRERVLSQGAGPYDLLPLTPAPFSGKALAAGRCSSISFVLQERANPLAGPRGYFRPPPDALRASQETRPAARCL